MPRVWETPKAAITHLENGKCYFSPPRYICFYFSPPPPPLLDVPRHLKSQRITTRASPPCTVQQRLLLSVVCMARAFCAVLVCAKFPGTQFAYKRYVRTYRYLLRVSTLVDTFLITPFSLLLILSRHQQRVHPRSPPFFPPSIAVVTNASCRVDWRDGRSHEHRFPRLSPPPSRESTVGTRCHGSKRIALTYLCFFFCLFTDRSYPSIRSG